MYNQDIREGEKKEDKEKKDEKKLCFGRGFKHLFIGDEWV